MEPNSRVKKYIDSVQVGDVFWNIIAVFLQGLRWSLAGWPDYNRRQLATFKLKVVELTI